MVSEVPAYQNTRLLTSVGNSSFKIYHAEGYLSSKSEVPEGNEVSRKRNMSTDRASISTNMLRVTPSSASSVKVILQIT